MRNHDHRPRVALRPYVERIWAWQADRGETIALPTLLPGTGAEFFIHCAEPSFASEEGGALGGNQLLCLRRTRLSLASASGVDFVAARFRAGALGCFVPMAPVELMDRPCAAGELWGAAGRELVSASLPRATSGRAYG